MSLKFNKLKLNNIKNKINLNKTILALFVWTNRKFMQLYLAVTDVIAKIVRRLFWRKRYA